MDRRTEDLRVLRTHTLLLRALSDLLQEKPFDEIRVKDLCQRAMVHRSTFYAHFEDKRHLLTFGMQAFLDDLTDGMPCSDNPAPFRQAIEKVFQYFLARRQEYARLFLDPRNAEAKEIFREEFARVLTEQTLHHPAFTAYTREEIVVLCQFFAGGPAVPNHLVAEARYPALGGGGGRGLLQRLHPPCAHPCPGGIPGHARPPNLRGPL